MPDKIDAPLTARLDVIAQLIAEALPDGVGFLLMAFEFGAKPGTKNWSVSNAHGPTLAAGVKQWLAHHERNGGPIPDEHK
jgi:hypothetical protein